MPSTTRANPSRGGGAKPGGSRRWPGCRKERNPLMVRRAAIAATCALALLLPSSAVASTSAAGHVRYAIDSAAQFTSNTAAHHNVVILQPSQTAQMHALKAAN